MKNYCGTVPYKTNQQGFTLIEIMVALAIFAILAAITAQAINRTVDTRNRVLKQANRLNEIQLALAIIQQDTESIVNPANADDSLQFHGDAKQVRFTRGGMVNPGALEKRSSLRQVAYHCKQHALIRRTWQITNAIKPISHDKVLLQNLSQCELAYLSQERQIVPVWSSDQAMSSKLPIAIRFNLNLKDWGDMSLLFSIPESLYGR